MSARISLDEFMALPVGKRREQFDGLAVADQLAFVRTAEIMELILGGYPSEERIIFMVGALDVRSGNSGMIH